MTGTPRRPPGSSDHNRPGRDAAVNPDKKRTDQANCLVRFRCGGGRGTRTPDLYSAIVALSQLSYAPAEQAGVYRNFVGNVNQIPGKRSRIQAGRADCGITAAASTYIRRVGIIRPEHDHAGVTQLVECLLPKQNVVGSSPITRSKARCTGLFARNQKRA